MKTLIKGLIATLIGVAANMTAFPQTKNDWIIFGVGVIVTIVVYFAQRLTGLITFSDSNMTNLEDFISSAIVAVFTAIGNGVVTFVIDGAIKWQVVGTIALTTFVGFITAKLKTNGATNS